MLTPRRQCLTPGVLSFLIWPRHEVFGIFVTLIYNTMYWGKGWVVVNLQQTIIFHVFHILQNTILSVAFVISTIHNGNLYFIKVRQHHYITYMKLHVKCSAGNWSTGKPNISLIIYPHLFEFKLLQGQQRAMGKDSMFFLCMCPAQKADRHYCCSTVIHIMVPKILNPACQREHEWTDVPVDYVISTLM